MLHYNITFVNSERLLAKSRVDITLCQHGKFPATLLLKFFVLYYKRNIKHFFRIDMYRLSYERQADISFIARETISHFVTRDIGRNYKNKPKISYLLIAANFFVLFSLYYFIFLLLSLYRSFGRTPSLF